MTLQQERSSDTVPSAAPRGKTGPGSALWLVWRQHGGVIVGSAVVTLVVCIALRLAHSSLSGLRCTSSPYDLSDEGPGGTCGGLVSANLTLFTWAGRLMGLVAFLPLAAGVFWGAPMVSREHERGTQGLAWGQGISVRRWLGGKLVVFGGLAVLLGLPVWLCARQVAEATSKLAPWWFGRFGWQGFATLAPMVVPYALAAFVLGVLCSMVLRKTLPAMALTGALCALLGTGTAHYLRPHYTRPLTLHVAPLSTVSVPGNALVVEYAWADAGGHPTHRSPGVCASNNVTCLAGQGISGQLIVYQPADREARFQWIEAGMSLLVAAAGGLLAMRLIRRR